MSHIHEIMGEGDDAPFPTVSWAGFHATRMGASKFQPAINSLLPLFPEKLDSPAMIRHGMALIAKNTEFLNSGQIPVMAVDQPLFAIAKRIQWQYPAEFGEGKFMVMFGAFHIEKTFLAVLGQLMEGCGWTGIVAESGIMGEGSAEAVLKVKIEFIVYFKG